MSTNEQEAPPEPTQQQRVLAAVGMAVSKVTDTGSTVNPGMPLRVWLILALLGAIVSVSTPPLNIVGVILVVALALTLASRSRMPR